MKISVCMATYNGSNYIRQQVESILNQLNSIDELIVIDDNSTDNTIEVIKSFKDSRVKLFENKKNIGVIKNFEKSISKATGEVLFLSDQDDIWFPHKIVKVVDAFQENPDVTLVLSDAEIIDKKNQVIKNSFFEVRGKFTHGLVPNFIKSKYHGCTIAFKQEMINLILPFPNDIPMHDIWIGVVNEIYGKTFYIPEPLMQYRLHESNVGLGPTRHASLWQMLKWRYILLKNLSILIYKNKISKYY